MASSRKPKQNKKSRQPRSARSQVDPSLPSSSQVFDFENRHPLVSERPVSTHTKTAAKWLAEGIDFHHRKQYAQAVDCYQAALELDHENPEAFNLLGVVAHQTGDHQTAIDLISVAISLRPEVADFHLNLGSSWHAAGDEIAACEAFRNSIVLDPQLAMGHSNLANVLMAQGRFDQANQHYQRAIQISPDDPLALANYASLLIELGEISSAETLLKRALELDPQLAQAACNLALIKSRQGDSIAAIEMYHAVLQQQPRLIQAWSNLGQLLAEQGAVNEAKSALEQCYHVAPRQFRKLKSESVCPVIPQSVVQIQSYRERLNETLDQLMGQPLDLGSREWESSGLNPPFYWPYHGLNDLSLKSKWASLFTGQLPTVAPPPKHSGKPHVGFVVTDRHVPVFWKFMGGFLQRLGNKDLSISVIGSRVSIQQLKEKPLPQSVELIPIPARLQAAAATIQSQTIDLLFHFEPDADAFSYFLASLPIARWQCTSWGIPVTSGLPSMTDYLSCQLIESESAPDHYSERLSQLRRLPTYYFEPAAIDRVSRVELGFQSDDHIYGCPHSSFKFHPEFDNVMGEILRQDVQGKIVVIAGKHAYWDNLLMQRWQRVMPDVCQRIVVLPRLSEDRFRGLLQMCDVLLDPIPFGGGPTTYDAIAVGTPIVTLPGEWMRGRVTAGCWRQIGIDSLVVNDRDSYIRRAIEIASNPESRQGLTRQILESKNQLFEDQAAVEEIRNWMLERIHAK